MTDHEILKKETRTLRGVVELFNFFLCQLKVPDVVIFLNSIFIGGLGNNSNSVLDQMTKKDLSWGFVILLR